MNEEHTITAPNPSPHVAPAEKKTASVITGDRLCTHCGYNLTGQTIMREPQYGLLIVRCPECSQVASVMEYPLLGRWANRWGVLLAGLYLIVMLGLLTGTVGAIFGMCYGAGEIAGEGPGVYLHDQINAWLAEQNSQSPPAPGSAGTTTTMIGGQAVTNFRSISVQEFQDWWKLQTRSDIIASAGGYWNLVSIEALWMWIPLAISGFISGCLWAVLALGRRALGLLAIGGLIIGLAAMICAIPVATWLLTEPYYYWQAGRHLVGPRMVIFSLAFTSVWLAAGMLLGRRIVRGLIVLFLPPRLRSSLAILWTVDGKAPPRTV